MSIINEGVGPALVGSLAFSYNGTAFLPPDFAKTLNEASENRYWQTQSQKMSQAIIQPGEAISMYRVSASLDSMSFEDFSGTVLAAKLDMCYCSVYEDCWSYRRDDWPERIADCPGVFTR